MATELMLQCSTVVPSTVQICNSKEWHQCESLREMERPQACGLHRKRDAGAEAGCCQVSQGEGAAEGSGRESRRHRLMQGHSVPQVLW